MEVGGFAPGHAIDVFAQWEEETDYENQSASMKMLMIERDMVKQGMDPTLEEEFKNYDSRLEDQVRASRERLIKGCMAAHKKCLMDIDEAKNLCIEETSKLEEVFLASLELRVAALEKEYKKKQRAAERPPAPSAPTGMEGQGEGAEPMEIEDDEDDLSDLESIEDIMDESQALDPDMVNPDQIGIMGDLSFLDEAGSPFSIRMLDRMNYFEARVRTVRDKFTDADRIARQEKEERLLRNRTREGQAQLAAALGSHGAGGSMAGVKRGRNGEIIAPAALARSDPRRTNTRQQGLQRVPWAPRPIPTPLATIRMLEEDERQTAIKRAARLKAARAGKGTKSAADSRPATPTSAASQASAPVGTKAVSSAPVSSGTTAQRSVTPPSASAQTAPVQQLATQQQQPPAAGQPTSAPRQQIPPPSTETVTDGKAKITIKTSNLPPAQPAKPASAQQTSAPTSAPAAKTPSSAGSGAVSALTATTINKTTSPATVAPSSVSAPPGGSGSSANSNFKVPAAPPAGTAAAPRTSSPLQQQQQIAAQIPAQVYQQPSATTTTRLVTVHVPQTRGMAPVTMVPVVEVPGGVRFEVPVSVAQQMSVPMSQVLPQMNQQPAQMQQQQQGQQGQQKPVVKAIKVIGPGQR